jgi:hypothetical protein
VLSTILSVAPALKELHIKYWDDTEDDEMPQAYQLQRPELVSAWAQDNAKLKWVTFPDGVRFQLERRTGLWVNSGTIGHDM